MGARPTTISLRVTASERERLGAIAAVRGLSVSDLIRSLVERETTPPPATETVSSARLVGARSVFVDHGESGTGVFWEPMPGALVDGATLTLSCAG